MANGVNEAIIRAAAKAIAEGQIPAQVSNEWLWAGMIARSQEEAKRDKKLSSIDVQVKVVAGTLVVYGGVLFLIAQAVFKHLGG